MPLTYGGFASRTQIATGAEATRRKSVDFVSVLKYNLCHDKGTGRFCSTSGGGGSKDAPEKKAAPKEMPKEKKAAPPKEKKAAPKEEPKPKPKEAAPKKKVVTSKDVLDAKSPKKTPKAKEKAPPKDTSKEKAAPKAAESDEVLTPQQKLYEAHYAELTAQGKRSDEDTSRLVRQRYLAGEFTGDEALTASQKIWFNIPADLQPRKSKGTGKTSDVKSPHAKTQALLDADTPEGVTAALTAMGWKKGAPNAKIAAEVRKHLFEALGKSPRGDVKSKVGKDEGITPEEVAKVQAEANLLMHPDITKQLSHKSVWVTRRLPPNEGALAHFSNHHEGMITMGRAVPEKDFNAIYVHEFGHKVESQIKGAGAKARKAIKSGTSTVNEYSQKIYDKSKATEYISSGFEHYYRDPATFAAKAPHHFAFIHNMVTRGVIG